MYDYRQIIHRIRMGQTDREIARTKIIGRTKCAKVRTIAGHQGWLDLEAPLPDDTILAQAFEKKQENNPTHQSLSQPFEEQINIWLRSGIRLTTIHRALVDQFDFSGSYSSVRRLADKLGYNTPPATCILDFEPAEAAQVDFGTGPDIPDYVTGGLIKTWIFVMTLCFSRHIHAEIVADQKVSTWLACHRRAFEHFNGVPRKAIIDNPKCAITRAYYYDPEVQRSYGELAEGYHFLISPCPPRDLKKKGRVESGVKYVKNAFVPLREFRSISESANAQLRTWIMETVGNRIHGTTRQKPLTLFVEAEKALLQPLPDVPVEVATWCRVKLHGNCHVQFEKANYSAPFRLGHQNALAQASDNTRREAYHNLNLAAVHPRLKSPYRSTVDDHMPPEAIACETSGSPVVPASIRVSGASVPRSIEQLFKRPGPG